MLKLFLGDCGHAGDSRTTPLANSSAPPNQALHLDCRGMQAFESSRLTQHCRAGELSLSAAWKAHSCPRIQLGECSGSSSMRRRRLPSKG